MAKSFADMAQPSTSQALTSGLAGPVAGTRPSRPRGGTAGLAALRHCNTMVYGEIGTGKTYLIIQLLLAGVRVYYVNTDFGKTGPDTVYNYFKSHPEQASLLENFREVSETGLDYKQFKQFARNPLALDPDIYTFDPDVLFWDGLSAFQQNDLETYIGGLDALRSGRGTSVVTEQREEGLVLEQSDWGAVRTGTLQPLNQFLELHNVVTGKLWSKVVTLQEDTKSDYGPDGKPVPGTAKTGPLLHGAARKIASAGFSVVLQAKKTTFGDKTTFEYVNAGAQLMVKDRGYEVPARMEADFGKLWLGHIAPKIGWTPKES